MAYSHRGSGIAAALGMLVLILDGKTALSGAAQGLELCIRTVIPSLFPFFVLSNLLISALSPGWLKAPAKLFGIPEGAEGIWLAGFLGGYPTGAQCVANAWKDGALTENQANRMLSFSNNAGPSFLFGMIAPMFTNPFIPWLLWIIHIVSALIVAALSSTDSSSTGKTIQFPELTLSQSLARAIHTMALVCGWIILFRIVMAFFEKWFLWLFPAEIQVALCGFLELSNGCSMLASIPSAGLRFILCSGMLGFGGLCVTMQTTSVMESLSIKHYLTGKGIQTLCSLALACLIQFYLPEPVSISPVFLIMVCGCTLILWLSKGNRKIPVAFSGKLMYNADNQNIRRDTYAVSQKN